MSIFHRRRRFTSDGQWSYGQLSRFLIPEKTRVVHLRPRFSLRQTRPWSCSVLIVCAALYFMGIVAFIAIVWSGR